MDAIIQEAEEQIQRLLLFKLCTMKKIDINLMLCKQIALQTP